MNKSALQISNELAAQLKPKGLMTPKQMAKKAFADWMNKAWDLPFGYEEHGQNEEFHKSTERVKRLAEEQFVKMLNRALKYNNIAEAYEPRG